MGIGTGLRRGGARATNLKTKYVVNRIMFGWQPNYFQDAD